MLLSDLSMKYEINFGALQTTLTDFSSNIISSLGNTISNGAISVVNSSVGVFSTGIVVICTYESHRCHNRLLLYEGLLK